MALVHIVLGALPILESGNTWMEDPIDLALIAIDRVAHIASTLGVRSRRPQCGALGAELLLIASYLNSAGLDEEERVRMRISKLLREIEHVCNVSTQKRASPVAAVRNITHEHKKYDLLQISPREPHTILKVHKPQTVS